MDFGFLGYICGGGCVSRLDVIVVFVFNAGALLFAHSSRPHPGVFLSLLSSYLIVIFREKRFRFPVRRSLRPRDDRKGAPHATPHHGTRRPNAWDATRKRRENDLLERLPNAAYAFEKVSLSLQLNEEGRIESTIDVRVERKGETLFLHGDKSMRRWFAERCKYPIAIETNQRRFVRRRFAEQRFYY